MYYKLVQIINNKSGLAKVILYVKIWHHGFFNLIVSNKSLIFILKYLFSLCYCNVMITGPVDHGLHVILLRELNP